MTIAPTDRRAQCTRSLAGYTAALGDLQSRSVESAFARAETYSPMRDPSRTLPEAVFTVRHLAANSTLQVVVHGHPKERTDQRHSPRDSPTDRLQSMNINSSKLRRAQSSIRSGQETPLLIIISISISIIKEKASSKSTLPDKPSRKSCRQPSDNCSPDPAATPDMSDCTMPATRPESFSAKSCPWRAGSSAACRRRR